MLPSPEIAKGPQAAPSGRRGPHLESYLAHVRPASAPEIARFETALRSQRDVVAGLEGLALRARTRRVLRTAHLLEADIAIELRRSGDALEGRLDVEREGRPSVRYQMRFEAGRLSAPQWRAAGKGGRLGAEQELVAPSELAPFAIGDLSVPDLVATADALAAGRLRIAGVLAGLGAREQLVVELRAAGGERAPGAPPRSPVAAHTLLLYVGLDGYWPTGLRSYDENGRLVREVSHVEQTSDPVLGGRPTRLEAESFAAGSRTAIRIDGWQLEDARSARRARPSERSAASQDRGSARTASPASTGSAMQTP